MGPKERKRRLAKQRVDRSHRGVVVRQHRTPAWTMAEKAALVLCLALIFVGVVLCLALIFVWVVLTVVVFVVPT